MHSIKKNKRYFSDMKCIVKFVILALLTFPIACIGQEEFVDLSTKERISIAEEEKSQAKNDAVFQNLMNEGHVLFENKHYLKAIRKYEEAQAKRPYNVYPKVIITDIELSMKDTLEILREAEKNNTPQPDIKPERKKLEKEKEKEEKDIETEAERLKRIEEWERKERERLKAEREAQKKEAKKETKVKTVSGDVQELSIEDFQKDLANKHPSGLTETTSKEGNKTIIKRIIVSGGKGNEYKKVIHDWGGIFYFKNGTAVPERVWKQETE